MWLVPAVLQSGEYYLFESDSEDEEDMQSEEQKPQKQTACQVIHTPVQLNAVNTVNQFFEKLNFPLNKDIGIGFPYPGSHI